MNDQCPPVALSSSSSNLDYDSFAYAYHDPSVEREAAALETEAVNESGLFSDNLSPLHRFAIDHAETGYVACKTDVIRDQLKKLVEAWASDLEKRDWNQDFIRLRLHKVATPEERRKHQSAQEELVKAFNDFVVTCTSVLLLEEALDVPNEDRKVKMLSAEDGGGIAGGKKFRCGHVWLKATVNDKGLYACTMDAQKTASAELRASSAILGSLVRTLNTSLSCCVITRGHFITGTANVYVRGEETLVYGSANAAKTIHMRHSGMSASVAQMARKLNLKSHRVEASERVVRGVLEAKSELSVPSQSSSYYIENMESETTFDSTHESVVTTLHMAVDVEGHVGSDGRFYIIDTARLFPPTVPGGAGMLKRKGGFMVELFRPEFLKTFCSKTPLSSDAFSWFGRLDYNEHNNEVRRVFEEALMSEAVPTAATAIESYTMGAPLEGSVLSSLLHQHGVNVRYMGCVLRVLPDHSSKRRLIMREMLVRCVKQNARRVLRESPNSEPADVVEGLLSYKNAITHLSQDARIKFGLSIPEREAVTQLLTDILRGGDDERNMFIASVLAAVNKVKCVHIPPFRELPELITELESELDVRREELGKDHPWIRDTLLGLVQAHTLCRDESSTKEKALQYLDEIQRLSPPPTYTPNSKKLELRWENYAWWILEIGNSYIQLGAPRHQKQMLEDSLEHIESYYGKNHVFVANILASLGITYRNLGDLRQSREVLERARDIHEKQKRPININLAVTLNTLASVYGALGMYEENLKMLERALVIEKKYYGLNNANVALTLSDIASVHGKLGDMIKMRDMLESAYEVMKSHYGPDHYQVAVLLCSLGVAHRDLKNPSHGLELLFQALEIEERHYGVDHYKLASTLESIGHTYDDLGDREKGIQAFERALAILEKYHGLDHYQVALALSNLANICLKMGEGTRPLELSERALTIKQKHFGPDHPQVARSLAAIGLAHGNMGNPLKKRENLKRAHAIFTQANDKLGSLVKTWLDDA